MKKTDLILTIAVAISALGGPAAAVELDPPPEGRVVFLGDTLIERAQEYGYLEYAFHQAFPKRQLTYRNLGWSADTLEGVSRASFDHLTEEKGWPHLLEHVGQANPDVIVLGYGMAESFAGGAGLSAFEANYENLIETLIELTPERELQFLLLSPIAHEWLPHPFPSPEAHNKELSAYRDVIAAIAARRGYPFIDLFSITSEAIGVDQITDNGIHLNQDGYRALGREMARALGADLKPELLELDAGATLVHRSALPSSKRIIRARNLPEGQYELRVDGEVVATASASKWEQGVAIETGSEFEEFEAIRQAIRAKNELFFFRWRPQNTTYLFLFRKHEQGQNAAEIPEFDPLIEEREYAIRQLLQPVSHSFQIAATNLDRKKKAKTNTATYEFGTPKQTLPEFTGDPNLEITLFAQNPLLAKPIQIHFDPQGRLWVVSSEVYPQIEPGQEANDKVLILEDTDGDHIADQSTVFADGLLIPTGIAPGDGGAYVGQSTQLLHFRDTDGDGRADSKRVVLSGFGTEDTHHILHTLRWGPEGRLYMNQSIYIHSHIETPWGVRRLNSGGLWKLNPQSLDLEVFLKGFCNPWGHHFDTYGQSFVTDGAGFQGLSVGVPGAMYFTYAGARRIIDSVSPGRYPKFCGLELVRSPMFPEDWQGDAITCDFRAHRITRFSIVRSGSAYVTTQRDDLVRTTENSFRPIDIRTGPDGALYVADWSNPIIQHGEVDFRDERRDHVHGRIWRIAYKDGAATPNEDLEAFSHNALLDRTLADNAFTREAAKRILQERGDSILPALQRWANSHADDPVATLEALWLTDAVGAYDVSLLQRTLDSEDAGVRAAGVRSLGDHLDAIEDPFTVFLADAAQDPAPQVRLEAVRALAKLGTVEGLQAALEALEEPMDSYLDYALWLTVNDLGIQLTQAIEEGSWDVGANREATEFALKALPPELAGRALAAALTEETLEGTEAVAWIDLIGQAGSPKELDILYSQILNGDWNAMLRQRALRALIQAAEARKVRPESDVETIAALLTSTDTVTRSNAIELAALWEPRGPALDALTQLALRDSGSRGERQAAIQALGRINIPESKDVLEGLAMNIDEPLDLRRAAALALTSRDLDRGARLALATLAETENEEDLLAGWRRLLTIRGAASRVTSSLPEYGFPSLAGEIGVRVAREGGRSEPDLVIALSRSANLEAAARRLTADEMRSLAEDAERLGDPVRGESLYRQPALACVACHAIGGVGGLVGPDLTSVGASAPTDYLVEALIDPNAKIKEGYHAIQIETADQRTLAGTLIREDSDQIFLRNAAGQEQALSKANITKRVMSDYSLMPAGLTDRLSRQDRLDLYAFLSKLGEPGDFDAARPNVARLWRLYPATIDAVQFGDEKILNAPFDETASWRGGWEQAPTLVNGTLSKDALEAPLRRTRDRAPSFLYATAVFEIATDEPFAILLEGHLNAPVWLDDSPIKVMTRIPNDSPAQITGKLSPGKHRLTIKFPADNLPAFLRAKSDNAQFSVD